MPLVTHFPTIARLAVLALALSLLGDVHASGEPQESLLYQNFTKANEILEAAIQSHGGPELSDRSTSFRYQIEGAYLNEGHYEVPWASRRYVVRENKVYSAKLQAIRVDSYFNYNRPLEGISIYDSTHGVMREAGASTTEAIEAEELQSSWNELFLTFPQEWLRRARESATSLRFLENAQGWDVIGFSTDAGTSHALFIDETTHLLHRVENICHRKRKGDRLEWREYTNYQRHDGFLIPMDFRSHAEGGSSQSGEETQIKSIEFGIDIDPSEFKLPVAFAEGFEDWAIAPPNEEAPVDAHLPVTDLGRGLYIVDLPDCDSRSLLVEFEDFSVIVEAGDRSAVAEKLLATAAHLLPEKPVRYVGMTHHHPLYTGGLRPYANRGIKILATRGNLIYYNDLTTRPYRIEPDAQQRAPMAPRLEIIDGKLIIEDSQQRIEFHAFDPGTHVEEFVLPYVPSHKLVITGDFVYFGKEETEPRPAGSRTMAIYDAIRDRDLDVETLVQTWFLAKGKQQGSMAIIEESVRLAKEAKHEAD